MHSLVWKLQRSKITIKIDFIGWVFQFGIFIDRETSCLWISKKSRIKCTVSSVTALGNKRNRNLPAETRNFPKPKFGSGFVPAHFQASWFRFRYLVLKFLDFLVMQEVLPWIPGLTRNFLVKPRTSWLTQEILGESCEESFPNQIFAKKNVCFLVIFRQFLVF